VSAFGADGIAGGLSLVTAEIVEDDDFALCQSWRQDLLDTEGESLLMGPSMTQGALIRSWRSAAMKVMVFALRADANIRR
jgi:hypothetical protein